MTSRSPPLVSVLLPYRDAGATLEEAIASVLEQRGVRLELVAVDDGSRDRGAEIVARAARSDARVVAAATGGVGIVGALAAGLAHARGELVARMDGDDVCLPDRLARQVELLASDAALGAVGTQVEAFPEEAVGEGLRAYVAWQNAIVTREDHDRAIFVESPLCHPSVMLRRDALEAVGPWRETGGPEDYDLWLRLWSRGYELAKVPEVLVRWRHQAGRATFRDPRYAVARFIDAKGPHLAAYVASLGRPVAVWGAGQTGKRVARAMERGGVRAERFVDIDPRKIGGVARGAPIVPPDAIERGACTIVVAVGARGARDLVRRHLDERGFVEGEDYVCAA